MVAVLFLGNLTIKPFTTPLMRALGIRTVLLVNAVLSVGCFGLLAVLHPGLPVVVVAAILTCPGRCVPSVSPPTTAWRSPTWWATT